MLQTIAVVLHIVSLLCYLFVIYQMFTNTESIIAIVCLVGLCLFGLGGIIAFVYGWIKAREWEIVPVMAIWSGCVAAEILAIGLQVLIGG